MLGAYIRMNYSTTIYAPHQMQIASLEFERIIEAAKGNCNIHMYTYTYVCV